MVISALRVEIATTAGADKSAQPDELEIAAAMAAIVAYTSTTDILPAAAETAADTTTTGWSKAAYREATGGTRVVAPQNYCKLSSWQAQNFFKVCLSLPIACLSVFLATSAVWSQELRPLPADQDLPEPAPQVTRYTPVRNAATSAATTTSSAQRRNIYSKIAAPQGYPFINGKTTGTTTLPATSSPSLPYNGQLNSLMSPPAAAMNKAVNNDGWIEDAPDDGSSPLNASSGSAVPYDGSTGYPITGQSYAPSTVIMPSAGYIRQANAAQADQSVQAATQLNPAFLGKKTIIKIGLSFGQSKIDLASIDGAQIRDAASGALVANLRPTSRWDLALVNSGRSSQLAITAKRQPENQIVANTVDGDSRADRRPVERLEQRLG